jgi:predicted ATPase/DNA-binding CsgD family transcriptional regulator
MPNNLPLQLTSFIGRGQQITEITRLLGETRLLTLTGTGGVGKTRLALQVADGCGDRYADGVWWVDLANVTDDHHVIQAVASSLGIRHLADRPLIETLEGQLRSRRSLVVLDNCEGTLEACRDVIFRLLSGCPLLRFLTTSRQVLNIPGEVAWRVPSLELPPLQGEISPERIGEYEAVVLFRERARAADRTFALTDHAGNTVVDICRKLDGIPLAIELAAARVPMFSVQDIAARLEADQLRLLNTGSSLASNRQQTLKSMIDWSFALVPNAEQRLFERLSTFAAGCTLDAAEAVCGYGEIGQGDVPDLLSQLVDKSMVIAESRAGSIARYRLLEPLRQYAHEQLSVHGDVTETARRHAVFFLQMAEQAEPHLIGADQQVWLDRMASEHDNLRVAVRYFIDRRDVDGAERLVGAGRNFWFYHGHLSEGRALLAEIFDLEPEAQVSGDRATDAHWRARHAKALHAAVGMAFAQGDYGAAEALGTTELQLRRMANEGSATANALLAIGFVAKCRGEYRLARERLTEGARLSHDANDDVMLALNLASLAEVAYDEGNYPEAGATAEQALEVAGRAQFPIAIAEALLTLGNVSYRQASYASARSLLEKSLQLARELGRRSSIAAALTSLSQVANAQHDGALALMLLRESLALAREIGDRLATARALEMFVALGSDPRRAAVLAGAVLALREGIGAPLNPIGRAELDRHVGLIEASIGSDVAHAAEIEGQAMPLEEAISLALEMKPSEAVADVPSQRDILTPREREVAALVARGWKNREIAQHLVITEKTAKNHVAHILAKLGLASRARLAALTRSEGWSLRP